MVQDQKFGSLRSSSDAGAPICKERDIHCNSAKREKNPLQVSHLSHSAAVRRFCSRHFVFTNQQCHRFHAAFFHFIVSDLAPWCWCYNKTQTAKSDLWCAACSKHCKRAFPGMVQPLQGVQASRGICQNQKRSTVLYQYCRYLPGQPVIPCAQVKPIYTKFSHTFADVTICIHGKHTNGHCMTSHCVYWSKYLLFLQTLKLVPDVRVHATGTATVSGTWKRYSPGGGHVFMSYPAFAAVNASCQAAANAE